MTVTMQKWEGPTFTGDKTINGNIILLNGADRAIYVAVAATATAGDDLSLYAGNGTGTGDRDGGDLYLHGGDAANSGTDGDVLLCLVNGGAARGNVGVGVAPSTSLFENKLLVVGGGTNPGFILKPSGVTQQAGFGSNGAGLFIDVAGAATATNNTISFRTTNTNSDFTMLTRAHITSAGVLLVNATAAYATNGQLLEVNQTADDGGIGLFCWSTTDAERPLIEFHKSANATIGTKALVANGEAAGGIVWKVADGATNWQPIASIEGYVDAAPGAGDTAGRLVFSLTADGASTPTERGRFTSAGKLLLNGTTAYGLGTELLEVNVASNPGGAVFTTWSVTASEAPRITLQHSKDASIGTYGATAADDVLGYILFRGVEDGAFINNAEIKGVAAGTSGGYIVISTCPGGSSSLTEAVRVNASQRVGIGQTTITALLHLKAGAAAASSAPLKFATGPLLTTPEAGAMEFLSDGLYFTVTTNAARQQLASDKNIIFWENDMVSYENDAVLAA